MSFNLFEASKRLVEVFEFRNKHGDLMLDDTMALHYLDLTKFNKSKPKKLRSRFENWLHILKFGKQYVKMKESLADNLRDEEGVSEVVAEMIKINADDEKRQLMEAAEKSRTCMNLTKAYAFNDGMKQGIEKGIKQGIEKGSLQRNRKIAVKMINKGMPYEEISEITDLTIAQIEALADKEANKVNEPAAKYNPRHEAPKATKK